MNAYDDFDLDLLIADIKKFNAEEFAAEEI